MKTPEEAIQVLEVIADHLGSVGRTWLTAADIREAVKILKPLATQDRERLALTQHWES